MHFRTLINVLWWGTPVLMTLIAIFMWRRKLHREFPYFFNYVVFQVISFAVEFPLSLRNGPSYYWASWSTTALSVVLSFAVLLEIFRDAFRPYEALRDLSSILFRWCALVVLLVAGMWAVTTWNPTNSDNVTSAMLVITRCVRMMQCGLVFFMLLFSEYLGISRRNVVFGISIGFGFFAAVNMLVMTALNHHTIISHLALRTINSFAYIIAMLIWLTYTALPMKVRSRVVETAGASLKWDSALDEVRNVPVPVSLLDTMDETVERLLYHRGTDTAASVANRR